MFLRVRINPTINLHSKSFNMKSILTLFCSILFSISIFAQIPLTTAGYINDFDTYVGSLASLPTGWTSANLNFLGIGTGSGNTGGTIAYGTSNEYSLGALRSNTASNVGYEVSFVNNSPKAITDLEIAYDFEQWRYANTSGINVTSSLGNVSSLSEIGISSGTNGTATVIPKSVILSNLNITPSSTFTITFSWTDASGSDNGLSIDNFRISSVVLPIILRKYSLDIVQGKSNIIWLTTEETDNSHFTIDHSTDGKNFNEIGRVEANQDRSGEKDYAFAHESPTKGINYYRLNQFDLDGKKTTFGILAGNFEGGKEQFLFPTTAVNEVWLSGYESAPVKIFDASGKELINESYQTGNSIDVSNLQSGVYFLLIGQDRLSFLKY